jgi:uncharacterized protein YbjT (DUF2867 family)
MSHELMMKRILIAGASGFVGGELIQVLLQDPELEIVALSRKEQESEHPRMTWKKCDLFSLKDIRECMVGCDSAYYLVHSMIPSAALTQGEFYDFDLILADNFVRAAKENKLSHIIYLSGMVLENEKLSWHLKSRLEVEQTLQQSGARLTTLRAGLVVGKNGSSFTILKRLIERLPLMICPSWTSTRSQPIALPDLIKVLVKALYDVSVQGKSYDTGGRDVVSYQDLLMRASRVLGQKRRLFTFDLIPLGLSRLWVSLITGESRDLVYPLVLSLTHPMVVDPKRAWPYPEDLSTRLDDALAEALMGSEPKKVKSRPIKKYVPELRVVRSVQRLVLPRGKSAEWLANRYFTWLPRFFKPLIRVSFDGSRVVFSFITKKIPLLILEKSHERSSPDRQLFYIVGGLLVSKQKSRARLEFREVMGGQLAIAAIHDFYPSLPWYIYVCTQAQMHLFVMHSFNRSLERSINE